MVPSVWPSSSRPGAVGMVARWISPYGSNVYLSLLWRFELAPMRLSGLSLAAGIAVLRTLREFGAVEAGLKWPNDILWQQKKLAGLLLEVSGESEGPAQVVLGVGFEYPYGRAGGGHRSALDRSPFNRRRQAPHPQ